MKRILFNATHAEELRMAIVDGQKLIDLDFESTTRVEKKGNIYKGVITKIEPSLEAAFVTYGATRQGFLPMKEIYRGYFKNPSGNASINSLKIESMITEGQEMLVQVQKDERGTKGAALTTFISLAGRFLVLMPNNPKGGGISRRVSGDERSQLREIIANLEIKSEHVLIARTAGIGRNEEELQWDLDTLNRLWETIEQAADSQSAPCLIYQESNLIVRSIRDHLSTDIAEIIIDDDEIYQRAKRFVGQVMPHYLNKVKYYSDNIPLFSRYQIEHQIDSAFNRHVHLPSGGSIVIDHTEALVSIDVNSARATRGGDIEETALQTNLEAVEEIARQLRIRDLGGLLVMDLIDMGIQRNQRAVEARLKESLKPDRARVQVGQISRFGLLEMSRQRLRSSLSEYSYRNCPRCSGNGVIRSVESSCLNLLRLIADEALKENTEAIQVVLPLDMATYILNEKRHEIHRLESDLASRITIVPTAEMDSPQFQINRLRSDEMDKLAGVPSYEQKIEPAQPTDNAAKSAKATPAEQPQVQLENIPLPPLPSTTSEPSPADTSKPEPTGKRPGLWQRLKLALRRQEVNLDVGEPKTPTARKPATPSTPQSQRHHPRSTARRGRGGDNRQPRRGRPQHGENARNNASSSSSQTQPRARSGDPKPQPDREHTARSRGQQNPRPPQRRDRQRSGNVKAENAEAGSRSAGPAKTAPVNPQTGRPISKPDSATAAPADAAQFSQPRAPMPGKKSADDHESGSRQTP